MQEKIFKEVSRKKYIKLPKPGTNPRGVEITKGALMKIVKSKEVNFIDIFWKKEKLDYNPYKKWIDYWRD